MRQLSTKARRNCSNIGVAQIVAASWSDGGVKKVVDDKAAVVATATASAASSAVVEEDGFVNGSVQVKVEDVGGEKFKTSFLRSDGSLAVHAGNTLIRQSMLIFLMKMFKFMDFLLLLRIIYDII